MDEQERARREETVRRWFRMWLERRDTGIGEIFAPEAVYAEWYFRNEMDTGAVEEFEGVSLICWTQEGRIARLQEFGCNLHRYDPYESGPEPRFRPGPIAWF